MGGIDLDPASSALANETIKATRYHTRDEDGLAQQWRGRVFLNPPFGVTWKSWIIKLTQEIDAGSVQQAVVVGQGNVLWAMVKPWFGTLLRGSFLLPNKPIQFYDPPTGKWVGVRYGSFVCYIGSHHHRFDLAFRERGTILRPVNQ
jgi:ParB family chromosome partitioning protein